MISPHPQQVRNPNCACITVCQLQMEVMIPGHGTAHWEGGGVALLGGGVALQGGGVALLGGGGTTGRGWQCREGDGSTHCTALPVACSLKGLLVRRSPQNLRLHMASLSGG